MRAEAVNTPLFGRQPLAARTPRPRTPRTPRPIRSHVAPLEELLLREFLEPETKDPFFEWRNDWQHPTTRRYLAGLPNDYQHSVAWLRANRPSNNGDALRFWLAPLARAHMLNALLMRDDRTLASVQADMQIPRDKVYQYLQRWGITFEIRRRHVIVEDDERRQAPGRVRHWRAPTGTAVIRLDGYATVLEARFDRISRTYRMRGLLPLLEDELLPTRAASLLLGVSEAELDRIIPTAHRSNQGVRLYTLATLEEYRPRNAWRMTPDVARRAANACRCVYWDDHLGGCGLKHTPPSIPTTCEDHYPLEGDATAVPTVGRTPLARALTTVLRHYDELAARDAAPDLWGDAPPALAALGLHAGERPPRNLRAALASIKRILDILNLPPDRAADLVRIARHVAFLMRARAQRITAPPALLREHRLVTSDRLTLRGAAVLNELETLAAQLDTYAC